MFQGTAIKSFDYTIADAGNPEQVYATSLGGTLVAMWIGSLNAGTISVGGENDIAPYGGPLSKNGYISFPINNLNKIYVQGTNNGDTLQGIYIS